MGGIFPPSVPTALQDVIIKLVAYNFNLKIHIFYKILRNGRQTTAGTRWRYWEAHARQFITRDWTAQCNAVQTLHPEFVVITAWVNLRRETNKTGPNK